MFRPLFLSLLLAPAAFADPGGKIAAKIEDSPETTLIRHGNLAVFRIDWLNLTPAPADFTRTEDPARPITSSTYKLGNTHITRTILSSEPDGAIFLHFIADQPGYLSFRSSLASPDGKIQPLIENRRELSLAAPGQAESARAWIIPFESDVETDGTSILLRGEGECLLILKFNPGGEKSLAETWKRIAETHDPGQNPPDPSKIWQSILRKATTR